MIGGNWNQPPEVLVKALRYAFPHYRVSLSTWPSIKTWPEPKPRFELVSIDDSNPWCLISDDPKEIWRELKGTNFVSTEQLTTKSTGELIEAKRHAASLMATYVLSPHVETHIQALVDDISQIIDQRQSAEPAQLTRRVRPMLEPDPAALVPQQIRRG